MQVGGLPLIHAIAKRMRLKEILYKYIPVHGNEDIPAVETLVLLVYNLILGKDPLYEMEEWVESIDFRCINNEDYENVKFNDDRFGRVLNKLYLVDRASLMTEIVVSFVKEFEIALTQLSNDSTSIKAFGRYPGKTRTGLELKKGHSKDHRPDLKQLVFSLSIAGDGAVPVHYKCYPGNVTDDQTHIETWDTLRKITGYPDFLYVADSKLCTDEQLSYIVGKGGRAVTIIPETWNEVESFRERVRKTKKAKDIIWRRRKPGSDDKNEYFSAFRGDFFTIKRGYKIHWIYSSEKRKRDRENRDKHLEKVEQCLAVLNGKINKRGLKTSTAIESAAKQIVEEHKLQDYFHISIGTITEKYQVQIGTGRPGKNTKYRTGVNKLFTLSWTQKKQVLKEEAQADGVFPLLCTDNDLTVKEVLKAYKYQPRLEKRFSQFKTIHNAAPLLFKKIERIEANMFGFFIALVIQALIEREVRNKMKERKIETIIVYPEQREAIHPTTSKILDRFDNICTYKVMENSQVVETFRDSLNEDQKLILSLLNIRENDFWKSASQSK
ncbi:MAG: IS1634 family transposase [Desulfobacteraceae bacterium]|nr:IS1634 family transposase [Desulfobacteraceae bacterium]MBC2719779.1 IS1634 family transposase [Desulfobacteraceae bacterium]